MVGHSVISPMVAAELDHPVTARIGVGVAIVVLDHNCVPHAP